MRALVIAVLSLLALASTSGCDEPPAREIWRFAIEEPRGSVQDAYAQRFKALVEERTQGAVRIIVYPYGTLGTSDHITEQLHNGTLQLAMSSPGHLGKLIPEVQAFLLHFLMTDDQEVNASVLRDPELRRFLDEIYSEKGLAFLTAFGEGWQVWTTQKPVRSPADFEGLRFRVMTSPLLVAAYAAYGANPTPLPYAEVYSGLQLKMIDGQVNPVFAIEEMSFYEVTQWMIFPRHAEFVTTVAANPAFLAGLSASRRALVEDVVAQLQDEIPHIQSTFNEKRLARIRQRRPDLQVLQLDEEQRARFRERALGVREQYVEMTGERGAALLAALERAVQRARETEAARHP